MKSMGDIKHSMNAIKETKQITKAMHLMATSKMKKALARYAANAVHFNSVRSTLKDILLHTTSRELPFLGKSDHENGAYVVIASDKGLCGGYNHNVLNFAWKHMQNAKEKRVCVIGQESRVYFEKKNVELHLEFLSMSQNPSLVNARIVTGKLIEMFNAGLMDEVHIVYTHYVSTFLQQPSILKLLPIDLDDLMDIDTEMQYNADIAYHPSPQSVFKSLVPQYITGIIYGCMVQSYASEQSAAMMAMENATKNAEEMLEKLSMEYNRARQYSITKEIAEIIGAQEALS
jgi:F-type H+-transporting ATPase subunit gamma